jgi:hypothetical protein
MGKGIGLGVGINRSNYAQGIFGAYRTRVIADGGVVEAGTCVDAVSSLLQSASLLLIPSGYKSGVAYSEIPEDGSGDMTFSRASDSTRVNSLGLVEVVSSNIPRLNYQNGGGGCPSLLLEAQRTNLALYSEQLNITPNVVDASTVTTNFYTSPDGYQNADQFTEKTANDRHGFYQYVSVSAQAYTISIFTKQTGRRYISFVSDFDGTSKASYYDLQNKTVVSSASGYSCSIEDYGNGWLRLIATVTASSGYRYIIWGGSPNGSSYQYAGSTSISQTFWGLQVEAGSYVSSYIPTLGTSVTRVADACYKTGISSLIGQTEGTVFLDCVINTTETQDLLTIRPGGTSALAIGTASNLILGYVLEGATVIAMSFANYAINTRYKIALAYKNGDCAFYVNGTQADTDSTAFTFSTALSSLYLGQSQYLGKQSFSDGQVVLFPTRLTNSQLAELTA